MSSRTIRELKRVDDELKKIHFEREARKMPMPLFALIVLSMNFALFGTFYYLVLKSL